MKQEIKVNNLANFEFWLGMFRPRTDKWKRDHLRYLKSGKLILGEQDGERSDKIKALQFLLN